jgi:dynein heavy chain
LSDLAQNFEEATVDKKEQEEKVIIMKHQLKTASDLNTILAREFDRNMQIYDSLKERIFCLPGACALAAGFLVYLGPYQFAFRRSMLTIHWVKCLNDRGLPLVLDSLSLIKGRVVKWQMESLAHLLAYSSDLAIPGEDWKVHFASESVADTFICNLIFKAFLMPLKCFLIFYFLKSF